MRPSEHQLEEDSRLEFRRQTPLENFVVRDESPDYGYDLSVEEFANESPTGRRFLVQLKATASENCGVVRLRVDRLLQYLQRAPLPVMLVQYRQGERELRYRWVDMIPGDFEEVPDWANQATISIDFSKADVLDQNSFANQVPRELALRHRPQDPGGTAVAFIGHDVGDGPLTGVLQRVVLRNRMRGRGIARVAESQAGVVVEVRRVDGGIEFEVRSRIAGSATAVARLRVSVGVWECGVSTLVVPEELMGAVRALDALVSFASVRVQPGRRFLEWTVLELSESDWSTVLGGLQSANALPFLVLEDDSWRSFVEAVVGGSISATIDQVMWMGLVEGLANTDIWWTPERRLQFRAAMAALQGDDITRGTATYNYGNALLNGGRWKDATIALLRARKLHPGYPGRGYWWRELGVGLFEMKKYRRAAWAYSIAVIRGEEMAELAPRISEAWLRAGEFGASLRWSLTWQAAGGTPDEDWWWLVGWAAEMLMLEFGETVSREPSLEMLFKEYGELEKVVGSPDEEGKVEQILQLDPLDNYAWLHRGNVCNRGGDRVGAASCWTMAAVAETWDTECWARAAFTWIALRDPQYLPLAHLCVRAGLRLDAPEFRQHLANRVNEQVAEARSFLDQHLGAVVDAVEQEMQMGRAAANRHIRIGRQSDGLRMEYGFAVREPQDG